MNPLAWLTNRQEILTREYFPGLAPYIRRLRTPLGALSLAAVAAGLCGMFLHPQGFVVFFGVLAVMTLGLAWPWLGVCGLEGSLGFDRRRCREGETVKARLTLRNRMFWSTCGVAIKGGFHAPSGERGDETALVGVASVPPRRTIVETVEFVPRIRGEYPMCRPRVVCGFPFGLWEASRPLKVTESLLVWPRTFPVPMMPETAGARVSDGLATRDRAGQWGDPLGVRPYRRGDPLRRVHWVLTARHGELIVRELQSNAVPRIQIVLDAHPAAHRGSGPDGSREWGVRVAASLAEGWSREGAEVELVLDRGRFPARGGTPRARSAALLDALARLAPSCDRTLAELLRLPECRSDGGLRVIVTTDIGIRDGGGEVWQRPGDVWIVLQAAAFGSDEASGLTEPFLLPVTPWIRIDGPEHVTTCLRRPRKEVLLGG
jgi:uncharacterized protein (DUF58 family)